MVEIRLAEVREAAPRIRVFGLEGVAGPLPGWAPGAHVELTLPSGRVRAYSLMPAPEGTWRIAVLAEPEGQGGSVEMHGLAPGTVLQASAPTNDFALHEGGAPGLFLAGGIGITPMPAMVAALRDRGAEARLFYAGRSRGEMAFLDELPGAAIHADDAAGGFPDFAAVIAAAPEGAHLYICGPRAMIEAVRAAAAAQGVPHGRIHVELFQAASPSAADRAFEVVVASTGAAYTVPPGRTILEVLEDAGLDLVYDCQRGDCGICQTEVLEGVPDHRDVVLSEAERAAGKVMQICVSRAKSGRLVLDL